MLRSLHFFSEPVIEFEKFGDFCMFKVLLRVFIQFVILLKKAAADMPINLF